MRIVSRRGDTTDLFHYPPDVTCWVESLDVEGTRQKTVSDTPDRNPWSWVVVESFEWGDAQDHLWRVPLLLRIHSRVLGENISLTRTPVPPVDDDNSDLVSILDKLHWINDVIRDVSGYCTVPTKENMSTQIIFKDTHPSHRLLGIPNNYFQSRKSLFITGLYQ